MENNHQYSEHNFHDDKDIELEKSSFTLINTMFYTSQHTEGKLLEYFINHQDRSITHWGISLKLRNSLNFGLFIRIKIFSIH